MRYTDWQARFRAQLSATAGLPWQWGTHDCVCFAASMANAISDKGYLKLLEPFHNWTTERAVLALLKEQPLSQWVTYVLGAPANKLYTQHGDLVLIEDDAGREAMTVFDGVQLLHAAPVGWKTLPFLRYAKLTWRVQ